MLKTSKVRLPYEPGYTGHWEAKKRRQETLDWLRQREIEVAAQRLRDVVPVPSIMPEEAEPAG
jgi:hypothetical protein